MCIVKLCCIFFVLSCYAIVASGECPSLSAPLYGFLSTTSLTVNTTVTVSCESGFIVYGASSLLRCLVSNQWNYPVPLCVVDCSNNNIVDVNPFTGERSGAIVPRIELSLVPYAGRVAGVQIGTTVAYQYFGQIRIPGPTILMRAGTICTVRIINKLSNPPAGDADFGRCPYFDNQAHCLNTTNLHVHGLHVAPQEDNVDIAISPGTYYDYIYHIPDDHQAGSFWYHAHFHGSIDAQVGLVAGPIIMEQNEAILATPTEWSNLYVDQRLVFFQEIAGTAFPNNNAADFYIVNGNLSPSININSKSWTLLRFVHAAGQFVALSLNLVDPSHTCQMVVVARDGIPQFIPFIVPQNLVVPQAGRADVALYCDAAAEGTNVTMQSIYAISHAAFLSQNDVFSQSSLFTLNVQASPYKVQRVPIANKPLPPALQDLTNASATPGPNITLSLTTGISGVSFTGMAANAAYINPVPLQLDKVYSYGISADLSFIFHPYHQHINALQIQSFSGAIAVPEISRPGEWRDVLPIHGDIIINVKQKPLDFWGQQVLHCHILVHEEGGMMGILRIAKPDSFICSKAYAQPGYNISGCDTGTPALRSCSATCASGYRGRVAGSVSCQQIAPFINRASYAGSFSGCTAQ